MSGCTFGASVGKKMRQKSPNQPGAVNDGISAPFQIERPGPAVTDPYRSAPENTMSEKIDPAQPQTTIVVAGLDRQRVRYGEEAEDWGALRF